MKKITIALLIVFITVIMFACVEGEDMVPTTVTSSTEDHIIGVWPDGETTLILPREPGEPLPTFEVPEGMTAEEFVMQAWEASVENILQADIARVEYVASHRLLAEPNISFTEDSALIERWKELLRQLRLSVIPFEILFGAPGISLTFYSGDVPFELLTGHPTQDVISIAEGRIGEEWWNTGKMLRIDNFDEVGEEFLAILREMGVTRWEPVE